ncbi:HlyD family efflux transporter periplasmic adaptor subunit [Miniphocaeibacter massiliensis]|uniref:HlyD family efflux transporter periplasmic adaptor subunit n=1 Tax=Miniphocaeibacter massiliensis TaxID=2041841 RepID=UPI000C07E27F|nr:HlyD family efflux transporter periplasmic adaptor subunit [Miniphocaeibacter massiliensis]
MRKAKLKRKKQIKINIFFIIILLIVFVFIRNIYMSFIKNSTISLNNPIKYEKAIDTTALVVRDEHVYAKSGNRNMEGLNELKIKVNSNIGDLSNSKKTEMTLKEINNAISIVNGETEVNTDTSDIHKVIELIRNKDYNTVGEIPALTSNINSIEYKEYLLDRYKILKKVLESNGLNVKSMNSGIISNKVDGYEDIYNIYNIKLENFNLDFRNIKIDNDLEYSGLKIINNKEYVMIFTVDSDKIEKMYEANDNIEIKVGDKSLIGTVKEISLKNNTFTIAAKFNTGFEFTKDSRFYEIELINYRLSSYEIPIKCLTSQNDIEGVYIKNPSGIVDFKPVKVINKNKENAIIDSGENGIIELNGKDHSTIKNFDEIIKNPKNVKLGELIE